ncbi:hypothetical protein SK128_003238 [Halocaridina rubra]|uniref:Uncharacterized protein n=1 Tax=Halocaridina rubra TaxID=373956 RepID=A0AAN9AC13_HALRR
MKQYVSKTAYIYTSYLVRLGTIVSGIFVLRENCPTFLTFIEQSSDNLQESIIKDSIAGEFRIHWHFVWSLVHFSAAITAPTVLALNPFWRQSIWRHTAQLLLLDESFSISEETNARNINCDLWTSMVSDFPDVETGGFQSHPKVELQICFAKQ